MLKHDRGAMAKLAMVSYPLACFYRLRRHDGPRVDTGSSASRY